MLHDVLVATPVMPLCLLLQRAAVTLSLRRYGRIRHNHEGAS
ncbi:hypothetical protein [Paraburkholderia adhaesiva]|nr:hypothetical protein [Paraburkholderia adhaesiva]